MRDRRPAKGSAGRRGLVALSGVARVVLGEDAVERATGVGEDLARLVGVTGGGDLHGRGADLEHQAAHVHEAFVDAAGGRGEGIAELLAVVVDVAAALVGELVGALALELDGVDQALVLQLLEGGVDGARAGLPQAFGAALEVESVMGRDDRAGRRRLSHRL